LVDSPLAAYPSVSPTPMRATVLKTIPAHGIAEARTESDILVVLTSPTGVAVRLGDELEFRQIQLNVPIQVVNITTGQHFEIHLTENDVHDLRLPARHGHSRIPSAERLGED